MLRANVLPTALPTKLEDPAMTHRTRSAVCSLLSLISQRVAAIKLWSAERGLWWATSVVVHALVLSTTLLVMGALVAPPKQAGDAILLTSAAVDLASEDPVERIEIPPPVEQPAQDIDLAALSQPAGQTLDQTEAARELGEGGPDRGWATSQSSSVPDFDVPRVMKNSGVSSDRPGPGRAGLRDLLAGRASGSGGGKVRGITGQTKITDAAVAKALRWLARHQNADGSWSIDGFQSRCKDTSCSGQGNASADAAATALGLLPFLAAGQTHLRADGKYRENVGRAAYWLTTHQKATGDLSAGSSQVMYSHGLAAIALAELFALSHDKAVGSSAQRGIDFIAAAQNPESGGWRYKPGERGDTSVAGWQIMALKSGQIAGLAVPTTSIELAHKWLRSTASDAGGLFSYEPGSGVTPTMTAVGLLATQYLGAPRSAPAIKQGIGYLMGQLPTADARNCYYWYYATQVLHNVPGSEWDEWNRRMRRILVESQSVTAGLCSEGSWDPTQPAKDAWGEHGGRLMVTSLNCLTLQVYYRYLPLYRLEPAAP
jgi:hypothetical protein